MSSTVEAKAIRIARPGGPDVLELHSILVPPPGPGEVRVKHAHVGVNFADTYFRSGLYPVPLPAGIGNEASGIVDAVGEGVSDFAPGDRVNYTGFLNTLGAYSTIRNLPASALIKLAAEIALDVAAASTMRGLTAAYLVRRIYPFNAGDTILLHAAAGGLGLIVSQWAKVLGIRVIGVVSSPEKAQVALVHGCSDVLLYSEKDLPGKVKQLTGGKGVDVVFDGVGKDTFEISATSLKRRGLLVVVGTASGPVPPVDPQFLARSGSIYLTRPALADYIFDPQEKRELATDLFGHIAAGRIKIKVSKHYALEEAAQAHRDLEGRQIIGSSVIDIPTASSSL